MPGPWGPRQQPTLAATGSSPYPVGWWLGQTNPRMVSIGRDQEERNWQRRTLHDGNDDGLEPLQAIDLERIESFSDLLDQMAQTAFSGRQLGDAFTYLCEMVESPSCRVVLTLSGAMTVAKQGKIISDMIDRALSRRWYPPAR